MSYQRCICFNEFKGNACASFALTGDIKCRRHKNSKCSLIQLEKQLQPYNHDTPKIQEQIVRNSLALQTVVMHGTDSGLLLFTDENSQVSSDVAFFPDVQNHITSNSQEMNLLLQHMMDCEVYYYSTSLFDDDIVPGSTYSTEEEVQKNLYSRFPRMNMLDNYEKDLFKPRQYAFDRIYFKQFFHISNFQYEDFFLRERILAPSVQLYTHLQILDEEIIQKKEFLHVLNVSPFYFDLELRHDYRFFFKDHISKKLHTLKNIICFLELSYTRLLNTIYTCALAKKVTNVFLPFFLSRRLFAAFSTASSSFDSLPSVSQKKARQKNISQQVRFALKKVFFGIIEYVQTQYNIATTVYASYEQDQLDCKKIQQKIKNTDIYLEPVFQNLGQLDRMLRSKQVDLTKCLLVNEWNPYTIAGQIFFNKNTGENLNVDSLLGQETLLSLISTSLTNPYLAFRLQKVDAIDNFFQVRMQKSKCIAAKDKEDESQQKSQQESQHTEQKIESQEEKKEVLKEEQKKPSKLKEEEQKNKQQEEEKRKLKEEEEEQRSKEEKKQEDKQKESATTSSKLSNKHPVETTLKFRERKTWNIKQVFPEAVKRIKWYTTTFQLPPSTDIAFQIEHLTSNEELVTQLFLSVRIFRTHLQPSDLKGLLTIREPHHWSDDVIQQYEVFLKSNFLSSSSSQTYQFRGAYSEAEYRGWDSDTALESVGLLTDTWLPFLGIIVVTFSLCMNTFDKKSRRECKYFFQSNSPQNPKLTWLSSDRLLKFKQWMHNAFENITAALSAEKAFTRIIWTLIGIGRGLLQFPGGVSTYLQKFLLPEISNFMQLHPNFAIEFLCPSEMYKPLIRTILPNAVIYNTISQSLQIFDLSEHFYISNVLFVVGCNYLTMPFESMFSLTDDLFWSEGTNSVTLCALTNPLLFDKI